MYPTTSTQNAVCFESLKSAALYFDSVIPVAFHSLQGRGEGVDVMLKLPEEIPGEALVHLVFGVTPTSNREKWTLLGKRPGKAHCDGLSCNPLGLRSQSGMQRSSRHEQSCSSSLPVRRVPKFAC